MGHDNKVFFWKKLSSLFNVKNLEVGLKIVFYQVALFQENCNFFRNLKLITKTALKCSSSERFCWRHFTLVEYGSHIKTINIPTGKFPFISSLQWNRKKRVVFIQNYKQPTQLSLCLMTQSWWLRGQALGDSKSTKLEEVH